MANKMNLIGGLVTDKIVLPSDSVIGPEPCDSK